MADINDFITFVQEELPLRPAILKGEGFYGDPNNLTESSMSDDNKTVIENSPIGTFFIDEIDKVIYQKVDNNSWNEITLDIETMSDKIRDGMTKDIVFQLGETIGLGPQHGSEIYLPYEGKVETIIMNVSGGRNPVSNFMFSFDKYVEFDTYKGWTGDYVGNFNVDTVGNERTVIYNLDNPVVVRNQRVRINLLAGDFGTIDALSFVARLNRAEFDEDIDPEPDLIIRIVRESSTGFENVHGAVVEVDKVGSGTTDDKGVIAFYKVTGDTVYDYSVTLPSDHDLEGQYYDEAGQIMHTSDEPNVINLRKVKE